MKIRPTRTHRLLACFFTLLFCTLCPFITAIPSTEAADSLPEENEHPSLKDNATYSLHESLHELYTRRVVEGIGFVVMERGESVQVNVFDTYGNPINTVLYCGEKPDLEPASFSIKQNWFGGYIVNMNGETVRETNSLQEAIDTIDVLVDRRLMSIEAKKCKISQDSFGGYKLKIGDNTVTGSNFEEVGSALQWLRWFGICK